MIFVENSVLACKWISVSGRASKRMIVMVSVSVCMRVCVTHFIQNIIGISTGFANTLDESLEFVLCYVNFFLSSLSSSSLSSSFVFCCFIHSKLYHFIPLFTIHFSSLYIYYLRTHTSNVFCLKYIRKNTARILNNEIISLSFWLALYFGAKKCSIKKDTKFKC